MGVLGLAGVLAPLVLLVGAALPAALLRVLPATVLLLRLIHGVEDAEIMFGVLEAALSHHAVAGAGRIAAKLEVFLKKLLRGAAQPHVGTVAVEDVAAIHRLMAATSAASAAAALAVGATPATATAAATPAATLAILTAVTATAAHALHVHRYGVHRLAIAPRVEARGPGPRGRHYRVASARPVGSQDAT